MTALVLMVGCGTSHYRRTSDKEVYRIIQDFEKIALGKTNEFTINTPYSSRDPQEIPPMEVIEDRTGTNVIQLDMRQSLEWAVRESRTYQTRKETLYLTALSLTLTRFNFKSQFFGSVDGTLTRDTTRDGAADITQNNRLGLSQAFLTGGSIGLTLINDLLRYYTGDPTRSALSAVSINLTQPILRGAGRKIVGENLKQAERDVIYAIRDYSYFQNTFAVDIIQSYFSLLQLKDIVRNNFDNYLSRSNAVTRAAERAEFMDKPTDLLIAQQSALNAKNQYLQSVINYQNTLDRFKVTLNIPVGSQLVLDDSSLQELRETPPAPVDLTASEGFAIAVSNLPPLLNDIDRYEDSKRKIYVAANALKPGFNLFVNGRLDSEAGGNYTDFNANDITWNGGFQLDLPLNRKRERNTYRTTLITFERQLRALSLSLDTARQNIAQGLRTLDQLRQSILIQQMGVEIAKKRVQEQQTRIEAGLTTQQIFIDAQDSLIDSQNQLTTVLVRYLNAKLQLYLDLGVLVTDQDRFWLQDPLPALTGREAQVAGEISGLEALQSPVTKPDNVFQPNP